MAIKKVLTTDLFNQYTTEQIKPYVDTKVADTVKTSGNQTIAGDLTVTGKLTTGKHSKNSAQVKTMPTYGQIGSVEKSFTDRAVMYEVEGPNGAITDDFNTFKNTPILPQYTFDFTKYNYYWAFNSGKSFGKKKTLLEQQNKYSGLKLPEHCHSSKDFSKLRKRYGEEITRTPTWYDVLKLLLGQHYFDLLEDCDPYVSYKLITNRTYGRSINTFVIWIDAGVSLGEDLRAQILSETKAHSRRSKTKTWRNGPKANLDCKLMIVRDVTVDEDKEQYISTDVLMYMNFVHIYITEDLLSISISNDISRNCENN